MLLAQVLFMIPAVPEGECHVLVDVAISQGQAIEEGGWVLIRPAWLVHLQVLFEKGLSIKSGVPCTSPNCELLGLFRGLGVVSIERPLRRI